MKELPLTQGKVALVSDDKFEQVSKRKWCAVKTGHHWYAVSRIRFVKGKIRQRTLYLHREIMGNPEEKFVDHIDGNGLNCQNENLRICSLAQNGMNSKRQSNNKSGFKGVHWYNLKKKWRAVIGFNNKLIYLGFFETAEAAARAYDEAAKEYHKNFARLNFPTERAIM